MEAGALLLRELADRLGYRVLLAEALADPRNPDRVRHPFGELLLTDLLLRGQGWMDHKDATALRHDPLLRLGRHQAVSNALSLPSGAVASLMPATTMTVRSTVVQAAPRPIA